MSLVLSRLPSCRSVAKRTLVVHAQARTYAVPANPNQSNAFKVKSNAQDKRNKKAFSRKNRVGAFRSIAPAQLSDPVFNSGNRKVLSLPEFSPDLVTNELIGTAVQFQQLPNDPIKYFGTPKQLLLEYRLLSQRFSVIRDVTVVAARALDAAETMSSKESRIVFAGVAGCGKSTLLLQTVRYCLAKDWIVIYIPRAKSMVNSTSTHVYDLRTQTYLQPAYAQQMLRRIHEVNSAKLSTINMQKSLQLERREIASGTPLSELASIGAKEQSMAPVVLEALLDELSSQTKTPVLLAIDDLQSLYNERTAYRDPHFAAIRPYHLAVPRMMLEFMSGKRAFANGAVLGSLTASDPAFPISVELQDALFLERFHPVSPHVKRNKNLLAYAKDLKALDIPPNFSLQEATTVFEVWMNDNALTAHPTDELFLSKYTETSGIPRDFVWKGLLATLEGAPPQVDEFTPYPHLREL